MRWLCFNCLQYSTWDRLRQDKKVLGGKILPLQQSRPSHSLSPDAERTPRSRPALPHRKRQAHTIDPVLQKPKYVHHHLLSGASSTPRGGLKPFLLPRRAAAAEQELELVLLILWVTISHKTQHQRFSTGHLTQLPELSAWLFQERRNKLKSQ